jgi:hypothetical protein
LRWENPTDLRASSGGAESGRRDRRRGLESEGTGAEENRGRQKKAEKYLSERSQTRAAAADPCRGDSRGEGKRGCEGKGGGRDGDDGGEGGAVAREGGAVCPLGDFWGHFLLLLVLISLLLAWCVDVNVKVRLPHGMGWDPHPLLKARHRVEKKKSETPRICFTRLRRALAVHPRFYSVL